MNGGFCLLFIGRRSEADLLQSTVNDGVLPKNSDEKKFKLNPKQNLDPISFEIEFKTGKKIYSYGLSINNSVVVEEWLYESGISNDDKLIFERKYSKSKRPSIKLAAKFTKTQKSKLMIELLEENFLKNNELLISKEDYLKIKEISNACNWIKEKLLIIYPHSRFTGLIEMISTSNRFNGFASDLLETFDTGISELGTEKQI